MIVGSMINNILAIAKKKCTHLMFTLYRRRWRENQAMISSVILDKIIMVLKTRIEDKAWACCVVVVAGE